MKAFVVGLYLIGVSTFLVGQSNPTLMDIPVDVFVNGGKVNFDSILFKDTVLKEKVRILHSYNELTHDLTVQTNSFQQYWKRFAKNWYLIQFKKEEEPILLFKGFANVTDEREYVQIYDLEKERNQRMVFNTVGRLLAYKFHPFTDELILFVHEYPCCVSASHQVYRIRQIHGNIQHTNCFFVGRDHGGMVGPFFPEKVSFSGKYHQLTQKTMLRWSPAVVKKNAFPNWAETNEMIHYEKGALYKILHQQKGWQFVIFYNGISHEQSRVMNYTNFSNRGVYGWIKK